jgi:hypothetical protein
VDLPGLAALLTPEGWALLESLPPYQENEAIATGERLRDQGHPPELVSAALTQSRLRSVARQKFGPFAEGMLFTPSGLEQATRFSVAARHAHRFTSAGIERVADLGCGIGADSMALATFDRTVLAVDNDELTAAIATMNLRHWPEATVRHEDVTGTDLSDFGGVFCDPARRTAAGRRVLDPRKASPPLSFVLDLASRVPAVGMKTAPGIDHDLIPADAEAQWISVGGEVVEAGLWFGMLARESIRRCALLLPAGAAEENGAEAVEVTDVDMPRPEVGILGHVLYEPDPAVIRAGLVGQVVAAVHGRLLDRSIAYVTSDVVHRTPLATAYTIEDTFPFQLKRLRTWLRDRGIGRVTIKKRGTAVDPDQLRRQLRLTGDHETTIVLTRIQGRQSVLVVRPLH